MHLAIPVLVWVVSFAGAYMAGRLWVEAKHAAGLPFVAAWVLAFLTALGFTAAYFLALVALLEIFAPDSVPPASTAGLWNAWLYWLAAPLLALGGTTYLSGWARTYREQVANRVGFQSYEHLNERYASINSTPQATRTVVKDLGSRTRKRLADWGIANDANLYQAPPPETNARGGHFTLPHIDLPKIDLPHVDLGSSDSGGGSDGDGGSGIVLLVILIVVAIIAVFLGGITTWVIISRIAGQSEPMPRVAPSRA